jgi:hypothetical protein
VADRQIRGEADEGRNAAVQCAMITVKEENMLLTVNRSGVVCFSDGGA